LKLVSGIIELSTFLMDEDDLACRAHSTEITEDGLLCAASIMMFITLFYVGSDSGSGARKSCAGGVPGVAGRHEGLGQNPGSMEARFCGCQDGRHHHSAVMMSRLG
jgi:hypothetical protein